MRLSLLSERARRSEAAAWAATPHLHALAARGANVAPFSRLTFHERVRFRGPTVQGAFWPEDTGTVIGLGDAPEPHRVAMVVTDEEMEAWAREAVIRAGYHFVLVPLSQCEPEALC